MTSEAPRNHMPDHCNHGAKNTHAGEHMQHLEKDPVCGMSVVTVESSLHLDHEGRRVWFCGSGCLRAFAADPGAYAPS